MTPFGDKIRELRQRRGITLKQLAGALELSPAYLSALEHGHRGLPTPALIVQICEFFNLIWDDYEEMHRLARLSHPRVVVDTRGLSPDATELANLLAERIGELDETTIAALTKQLQAARRQEPVIKRRRGRRPAAAASVRVPPR
jgi:transcriptional regulator with XRE-family HTH domain